MASQRLTLLVFVLAVVSCSSPAAHSQPSNSSSLASPAASSVADAAWIQAYNAAFVRLKARGFIQAQFEDVDPSLYPSLPQIADCPAVPDTYPFPSLQTVRQGGGGRLEQILQSKTIHVALQELPGLDGFITAFKAINEALAEEIGTTYGVQLSVLHTTYPDSDAAVRAVVAGVEDMTDPFYRQWTLLGALPEQQLQRQVRATPACTLWATFLSISWNKTRNEWSSMDDLRSAGSAVTIPLYSTVLPFLSEVRAQLPQATLLQRPAQNFEQDVAQLNAIFTEFTKGNTTALLAAKGDIAATLARANLDFEFNLDDVATAQTSVILPVGAWLPLPGELRDRQPQ